MKILGIFVAAIALLWTAAVAFFLGLAPFALTGEVMFLAGLLPFVIVVSVVIAWQWPRYRRRRRWEDMARVLGLSRDGPDSLRRVYKGFTVRISGTQEGSSETVIAVDSGGRIPRDVVLERGGQDSPDVRTGDAPFDAFVRVRGDEAQALALLGAAARKTVAAGLSALYCRVQDGAVGFRTPEGLVQLALLRQWLDTLTDIATALVLDGSEVPARLTWNALNDPVPAVRLRNLVVLLQRFQQSDAAREAVHVASTSPDAELRREAARALEQRGTGAVVDPLPARTSEPSALTAGVANVGMAQDGHRLPRVPALPPSVPPPAALRGDLSSERSGRLAEARRLERHSTTETPAPSKGKTLRWRTPRKEVSGVDVTFPKFLVWLGIALFIVGGLGVANAPRRGPFPSIPGLFVLLGLAASGAAGWLMRKLEVATPLDTAAAELGFLVSPDEDEIRGTVRGFAVSAKWVTRGKSSDTNITVDSGGTIPRTLALGPESILSKLRIAAGRGDVFTGDQAFDRAIRVLGDETMAVAWLDDGTRRMFQAQAGSLEVQNGVLTIERSGALGGPSLVEAVGSTVQLAERLTLRKDDVPGRLQLKVGHEPPAAARRALELLQLRFPDHPAAREAIQTALTSPVPELRLAAACYLGEQGLVHVRELVVSKAVPVDLRLEGLVHYGLAAPVPEALVLIDRVGGPLAEAELPAEVAERLANVHDAAREPVLLRLLARAPQSASMSVLIAAVRGLGRIGAATAVEPLLAYRDAERNGEVRRAAQHAIAQIQARLGDAEAGRLSVAALTAMGGRLTVADPAPAGGISLATESSATTTPLG